MLKSDGSWVLFTSRLFRCRGSLPISLKSLYRSLLLVKFSVNNQSKALSHILISQLRVYFWLAIESTPVRYLADRPSKHLLNASHYLHELLILYFVFVRTCCRLYGQLFYETKKLRGKDAMKGSRKNFEILFCVFYGPWVWTCCWYYERRLKNTYLQLVADQTHGPCQKIFLQGFSLGSKRTVAKGKQIEK